VIQIPTVADLSARIVAQVEASISATVPLLPKAFTRVVAKVLAGAFMVLYKYAGFMFLQIFVSTASGKTTTVHGREVNPLTFWGRLFGVGDPFPAIPAEYTATVSTTATGGSLVAGAKMIGAVNQQLYYSTEAVSLDAATVSVPLRAVTAGAAGALAAGEELAFVSPYNDVERVADSWSETVEGSDAEEVETYRQRVVDRVARVPHGGAALDYYLWAKMTPGVERVFVYKGIPSTVKLYVDPTGPGDQYLADVLDVIEPYRPINALVSASECTFVDAEVTVNDFTATDEATAKALIEESLEDYFGSVEPFIPGVSLLPRRDVITSAAVAGVVATAAAATGAAFTTVELEIDGTPVDVYSLGEGELATLDSVVWA
jgi:hypothetical protein